MEIDSVLCPPKANNDLEELVSESSSFGETGAASSISFSKQQDLPISQEKKR